MMSLEDSRAVASWVGGQEATYGRIETPEEGIAHIDAVTAEDVQQLADELIRDDRFNLALIGPYASSGRSDELLSLDGR